MSLSFSTATEIAAPPEQVWNTLLQTERWPELDTSLERVDGQLGEGQRVVIKAAAQSRPIKLKVTGWDPPHRLVLRGGMPLGLFTGTRTYHLDADGGGTAFRMEEVYTGPLAGLIGRSIPDLQPSFDAFAAGLKSAAEAA